MTRLNPAILGASAIPKAPPLSLAGTAVGVGAGVGQYGLLAPDVDMFSQGFGLGQGSGLFQQVSPPGTWPDPFMSYPLSGPITLDGAVGQTISFLSFENLAYPLRPITLQNCSDITIERVDSRRCSMGIVYAENCTNITVRYCRTENITGPHERPLGENRANVLQFNGVNVFDVYDVKGRYGDTEDAFSFFNSSNGECDRLEWEGATLGTEPTSDGGAAITWRSPSGTGAILGDGGAAVNNIIRDSTFLNPGAVGIAVASGVDSTFLRCIALSERASVTSEYTEKPSGENIAAYIWDQYGGCGAASMIDCRTRFANGDNYFDGGGCGPIDLSGSVFGDPTLNVEDYRVIL